MSCFALLYKRALLNLAKNLRYDNSLFGLSEHYIGLESIVDMRLQVESCRKTRPSHSQKCCNKNPESTFLKFHIATQDQ